MREELVFVGICDIAGHVRGKGFPLSELPSRRHKGVGWTHSNLMQSAFGTIFESPFGTAGDLMIVPDPAAEVRVAFDAGTAVEHFFLGDLRNTDGSPWECCPRDFARRGLAALGEAAGVSLLSAFEQEFVYTGAADLPAHAYSLAAWRGQGTFGETLVAALRAAGLSPDSFLPEYGERQFEMTVAPAAGIAAADQAVIAREMARSAAFRHGHRAVFSPVLTADGLGNGVHVHMSLRDAAGAPASHAPNEPMGLSPLMRRFCAGILEHLPAIVALTAPSPVSYLRLRPNRWAPTAIDIVQQDRGASLRVCPVFVPGEASEVARQFNVEFRTADAAASPYMVLGALAFAGADGIARSLDLPAPDGRRLLPASLAEALDLLAGSTAARGWMGSVFLDTYLQHKRAELAHVKDLPTQELCARYAAVY
ncbi:MAG: glutamine synthetase [Reyranella sp.]|uniref:glutamine synthetase n=1 Tax=Reyranella sp. TaxID=1929291 RepID=UPI003D0B745D